MLSLAAFIVALLGLAALLNMSLDQRRREMSIYRAMGARPWQVASLLLIEALLIGTAAICLGAALTVGVEAAISAFAFNYTAVNLHFGFFGLSELKAMGLLILSTLLAGLVPAIRLYRSSLVEGLVVTH